MMLASCKAASHLQDRSPHRFLVAYILSHQLYIPIGLCYPLIPYHTLQQPVL